MVNKHSMRNIPENKSRVFGKIVDFHTHILPGMDDGSHSAEESMKMIDSSVRQGVGCIVLTPHFYADRESSPDHFFKRRERSLAILRETRRFPVPVLIPGAEVQYFHSITSMEELPRLCVEKTNLLLLEMPFQKWTSYVLDEVLELNSRPELQIVIAHIDRYIDAQPQGTLEELLRHHILIQTNTDFFISRATRKRAMQMLENGNIHFIGSDCHNMTSRAPNMKEWMLCVEEKLGAEAVNTFVNNHIRSLLA